MPGITAAPVPITFADGTTYRFSPLTDRDIDDISEWLRATFIQTARKSLTPESTLEEREETLSLAMREAETITMLSFRGQRQLATIPGMAYLCFVSIRREHPNITYDELRATLTKPGNLVAVNEAFNRANVVTARRPGGNNASKKPKRPKMRARREYKKPKRSRKNSTKLKPNEKNGTAQ